MPTQPIPEILSREPETGNTAIIITKFTELLQDTVNFGTHVLGWDTAEGKGGDENVPIMLTFRHILDLLDSVSILVSNSCADPCKPLLRGVLESFFIF